MTAQSKTKSGIRIQAFCLLIWLIIVIAGIMSLVVYSSSPGRSSRVGRFWPTGTSIKREQHQASLVLFLHPHCACSHASLNELARLLAECQTAVTVQTVLYCPAGKQEQWVYTNLSQHARRLSDVPPIIDHNGREAQQFGVTTSGHVLLFSPAGERIYSGGLTSSRSHEGNNRGRQAITRLLNGIPTNNSEYPVFGCEILASNQGITS